MNEPKVLHLTIMRRWFNEILSGKKKVEYREVTPYWTSRLEGKKFTEIHFRNGYRPDAPFMRVKTSCIFRDFVKGKEYYIIGLEKILEVRHNGG